MGRGVGWPQWSTRCQLVSARGSPPCPRGPYSRGNTLFPTKDRHTHTHTHTRQYTSSSVLLSFLLSCSFSITSNRSTRMWTWTHAPRCVTQTEVRFLFFFFSPSLIFSILDPSALFSQKKKKKKKKGWRERGGWYKTKKKKKKKNRKLFMKLNYLFARYLSLLCLPPTVSSQSQPRAPLLAPLKARKKKGGNIMRMPR